MTMQLHYSSATPDWHTPPSVIERVQATFGGEIDCDPCSNAWPPNVPARVHYAEGDDGLSRDWLGNMNPPYGRGIGQWIDKALAEYYDGRTDALVMLLPARVDTRWWRKAVGDHGFAIIRGRLTFSGAPAPAPFPSAVLYHGPDVAAFRKAFAPPFADHFVQVHTPYAEAY
jgi:hypothetical protein